MTIIDPNAQSEDRRESTITRQEGGYEHQERIIEDVASERRLFAYRLTRIVYLLFGVLESLIGLRFFLKLIGANAANLFAHFIYRLTDFFLKPFAGLVGNPSAGGIVFEITTLIALLVYALLSFLIAQTIWLIFYRARTRTVSVYEKQHH